VSGAIPRRRSEFDSTKVGRVVDRQPRICAGNHPVGWNLLLDLAYSRAADMGSASQRFYLIDNIRPQPAT
jgi:hypothetical protein